MGALSVFNDNKFQFAEIFSRWMLILVFLFAGVPKLLDIQDFIEVIEAYGIFPEFLLAPVATVVSLAELAGVVGLVFHKKSALYLITLLLALFIIILSYGVLAGLDIDCGCFASEDPEYRVFSGLKTALVRDLQLLVPLFYLYLRPYIESYFSREVAE